jgi:hypothetical protein
MKPRGSAAVYFTDAFWSGEPEMRVLNGRCFCVGTGVGCVFLV